MKKLLKKLLRLFGRIKVADLDNDGKIESLREEIQGVFSQFKAMSNTLDKVNEELVEVIEDEKFAQEVEKDNLERIIHEANLRIEESEKVINKASSEIQTNEKLQSKVNDFIA